MSVSSLIAAMQRQEESSAYRCHDYFPRLSENPENFPVDTNSRVKLIEWNYSIADFCGFNREVVSFATSYIDRYLSSDSADTKQALRDTRRYQLLFMTSLLIAVKFHDPEKLDRQLLSKLSHGKYTADEFIKAEEHLLKSLNWRLSTPTSASFVRQLLSILPSCGVVPSLESTLMDFASCQTELAVQDYNLNFVKPSVLAVSAILNAMEKLDFLNFSARHRMEYLKRIKEVSHIETSSDLICKVRVKLRELLDHYWDQRKHLKHSTAICKKSSLTITTTDGASLDAFSCPTFKQKSRAMQ